MFLNHVDRAAVTTRLGPLGSRARAGSAAARGLPCGAGSARRTDRAACGQGLAAALIVIGGLAQAGEAPPTTPARSAPVAGAAASAPAGASSNPGPAPSALALPAVARVMAAAAARGFAGEVLIGDTAEVLYDRAFGLADRERGVPHRTGAVWRWASVTKQVTAALVLQQVDAGRLGLDDAVARHLPRFADTASAQVTLRQLLMHTSGLPNPDASPADASGQPSFYTRAGADLDASALAYCSGPPTRAAGERFEYNNCDTLVLGAILARLESRPYADIVQARIAQPLGLTSVRVAGAAPRAAMAGYDAAGARVAQPRLATFGAAAAIEGTAFDLLAFDRALLARRIVSDASTTAMWSGEPRLGYVALGAWAFAAKLAGCAAAVQLVERRGDVGGIQVRNVIAPALGRAVVVFTNAAEFEFGEVWQGRGFMHDLLAAALCGPST